MDFAELQKAATRWSVKISSRAEAGVADRAIPFVAAALLGLWFVNAAVSRLDHALVGPNLARYTQALENMERGEYGGSSLIAADVSLAELHLTLLMYPISLLVRFYQTDVMLLSVQAVAVALVVLPLWALCRHVARLRLSASATIIGAYALHPLTHELATADFHPETLAAPLIVTLTYAGARKNWILYWTAVVLILAVRADLGLVVALWGFVLMSDGEDRNGLRSVAVGGAWALGFTLILQPLLGVDLFSWSKQLFSLSTTELAVALLAPLLFLPVVSIRYLLPALLAASVYLISDGDIIFGEPIAFAMPLAMVATTYSIRGLGSHGVTRVFVSARILSAAVAAMILIFLSWSPLSPFHGIDNYRRDVAHAIVEATELLNSDVSVASSRSGLNDLSDRPNVTELPHHQFPTATLAARSGVEAILIVESDYPLSLSSNIGSFESQLGLLGYEVAYARDGVRLYSAEMS